MICVFIEEVHWYTANVLGHDVLVSVLPGRTHHTQVKLILGILPSLNKLSASPNTVKQNLILLCSSEDEAEA